MYTERKSKERGAVLERIDAPEQISKEKGSQDTLFFFPLDETLLEILLEVAGLKERVALSRELKG